MFLDLNRSIWNRPTSALSVLVYALVAVVLSGCGFALRSESTFEQIESVYLDDGTLREIELAVDRELREHGIPRLTTASSNGISIESIQELQNSRSTRVDDTGRVIEYQISLRWDTRVKEGESSRKIVVFKTTSIGLSENTLIGFEKEKSRQIHQLRSELAYSLLERIATIVRERS